MSEDDNIGSIEGAGKLLAIFGYWPSFHDAEVLWIRVDRKPAGDSGYGPTLEALIHAFEMTSEIDPKGYYVLRHHVLVHLRFREVVGLCLNMFNHQNVLSGVNFTEVQVPQMERIKWDVVFGSSYGVDASFRCLAIEVMSVEPCTKDGKPILH